MLKMLRKNRKGFTLVEVIVVAVIVAVLAAVAIPLYLGYVNSSRQNVVDNACGSLASFCEASKNSGTQVPVVNAAAEGTVFNGANTTTWTVPEKLIATITATNVTITHVDNSAATKTMSY